MAAAERSPERNSGWLDGDYGDSYYLRKRPKIDYSLPESSSSGSSKNREVPLRKDEKIATKTECEVAVRIASQSAPQKSDLKLTGHSQEELKEGYQQEPPQGLDESQEELKEGYQHKPPQGLDESQESEESEEEVEGLTPEELEETEGFKLLLECVERIAKNSIEEQKEIDQQVQPQRDESQDAEESEDEEGITYEELKKRGGYKLLLKYLAGTAKNRDDSEESEEEVEGLTPEELEETKGFKLLLKCVERIAKNFIVS